VVDALKEVSAHVKCIDRKTHRVLLLLDFDSSSVLEGPLDNIGLVGGALDELALVERRPELAEVLKLDQVPDITEGCLDDGRLADGSGGGDAARHDECICAIGSCRVFGVA
jgi:hypothetical protein